MVQTLIKKEEKIRIQINFFTMWRYQFCFAIQPTCIFANNKNKKTVAPWGLTMGLNFHEIAVVKKWRNHISSVNHNDSVLVDFFSVPSGLDSCVSAKLDTTDEWLTAASPGGHWLRLLSYFSLALRLLLFPLLHPFSFSFHRTKRGKEENCNRPTAPHTRQLLHKLKSTFPPPHICLVYFWN